MANVELASAFVSLVPSMRGVSKSLRNSFGPAAFSRASKGSGAAMAKSTTAEMAAAVKRSSGLVQKASAGLNAARAAEATAIGKVRVAETALATARGKYAAGSTQVVRAEEALAAAQRRQAAQSAKVATATRTLGTAQEVARTASSRLALAQSGVQKGLARSAVGSSRFGRALSGISAGVGRVTGGLSTMSQTAATTSSRAGGFLTRGVGSAMRGIATQAGGLAAAVGLGALGVSAVRAATDLDNTHRALTGMYGSGQLAGDMINRIKGLASTSPIDYSAYTAAAKQLAYMGLKGADAEQVLRNVSAAVVASGGGSEKMTQASSAMLKIVNSGKVYADQLNQISDAGVPIFSGLAKHFGTNIDNVREMVTNGKVGLEDVLSVIQKGEGKTFQQMIAGAKNVNKGVSAQFAILRNRISLALGKAAGPALTRLSKSFAGLGQSASVGIGRVPALLERMKTALDRAGLTAVFAGIGRAVLSLARGAWPILQGAIAGFVVVFGGLSTVVMPVLGMLRRLGQFMQSNASAMRVLGAVVGGLLAGFVAYRIGLLAIRGATIAWAVAQRVLNTAMRANPVGLIITAILALVGVLIYAYKNSETFRNIVNAVGNALKTAFLATINAIGVAIGAVGSAFRAVGSAIMTAVMAVIGFVRKHWRFLIVIILGPLGLLIALVTKYWSQIKAVISVAIRAVWAIVKTVMLAIWKAISLPLKIIWAIWSAIFRLLVGIVRTVFGAIAGWVKKKLAQIKLGFQIWIAWLRAGWRKLWNTVKAVLWKVFGPLVTWVKKKIAQIKLGFRIWMAWLRAGWRKLWNTVKSVINKVFGPIVAWVKRKIAQIKLGFKIWFGWIKTAWSRSWNAIKSVANRLMNAVKGVIRKALNGIKNAFRTGVSAIGKAWDRIKKVAKKPVRFVIDTVVNDWLIGGYNKLAGLFGVKKAKRVKPKGFATGGYTGSGGKHQPMGVVHGGEYVLRKKATSKLPLSALNYMNRTGEFPGYAKGGLVAFGKWLKKRGFRVGEHPAFGGVAPVHTNGSWHYRNGAIDANYGPGGQSGAEMAAFDKIIRSGVARAFGLRSIWRYPGHYNHAHFDIGSGPDLGMRQGRYKGDPTGFEGSGGLLNPFSGLIKKLVDKIPGSGKFAKEAVVGAGKKIISGAVDWFKDQAAALNPFGGGGGGSAVANSGPIREIVQNTAKQFGWGSGQQWSSLSQLIQSESSWNPRAQNPSSSAYGLFQFLDGTWGGTGIGKTSNPARQALAGMRYIKKRYGNPNRAWAFKRSHNWYDSGGMLEPGLTLAMNKTGKPEAVLTNDQFKNLEVIASQGAGPLVGQVYLQSYEPSSQLDELEFRLRKIRRGGVYA